MNPIPPSSPQPVIDYATPTQQPRTSWKSLFGWVLFIGLAVMLFIVLNSKSTTHADIPLSDFRMRLMRGDVAEAVIEDNAVYGSFVNPTLINGVSVLRFRAPLPQGVGNNWSFVQWVLENGRDTVVRADSSKSQILSLLMPLVPWLLILFFIWFFIFRQLRRSAGQPAAQAPAPVPVYVVNAPALTPPQQSQP